MSLRWQTAHFFTQAMHHLNLLTCLTKQNLFSLNLRKVFYLFQEREAVGHLAWSGGCGLECKGFIEFGVIFVNWAKYLILVNAIWASELGFVYILSVNYFLFSL